MVIIPETPIYRIDTINGNSIYIKREDLIPYSFGGNKVRKAFRYFQEIDNGEYDCIVTYGSASSNHCRIVANMAAERNLPCYIISTAGDEKSLNRFLTKRFGASISVCRVEEVSGLINTTLIELKNLGKKPYFIPGGGHGNKGTEAYDLVYDEIKKYEKKNHINFDFIFHASGTGTTQAGLICGTERYHDNKKVVGISIARKNPYGRNVIIKSIKEYLGSCNGETVLFIDKYICGGYGKYNQQVNDTIHEMMKNHGIPLDPIYTGKAFAGMIEYLKDNEIRGNTILFIHTGGTPLFFDWLETDR